MKYLKSVLAEMLNTISIDIDVPELKELTDKNSPSYKKPDTTKVNDNDQSKIAGKYFKSPFNVDRSMVSDQDRKAGEEQEQIRKQNETSVTGKTMSQYKFNKLFNQNGERSLNLKVDEEKIINSKDGQFTARLLPDGRVLVRRGNISNNEQNPT